MQEKVSEVKSSIDKLVPGGITDSLPLNLQMPQLDMNGLTDVKIPGGVDLSTASLPDTSIPELPSTDLGVNSNSIAEGIKSNELISSASEQSGKHQGNVEQVHQLKEQPLDKIVDDKMNGLSEVKEIQDASTIENVDAIKSQDAMKAELKKQVRSVAIDHFAGKEQQLKNAMDKISKYKAKYPSASSISDLKKKPVNTLKEKPLIERIVPEINHHVEIMPTRPTLHRCQLKLHCFLFHLSPTQKLVSTFSRRSDLERSYALVIRNFFLHNFTIV